MFETFVNYIEILVLQSWAKKKNWVESFFALLQTLDFKSVHYNFLDTISFEQLIVRESEQKVIE
jgi:hypothetical protein